MLLLGAAGQASGQALRAPRNSKISLLYVLNAGRGTLMPQPGHPGRLTLTLTGLERRAVWFSDRPTRRSGTFPISGLATAWKGFGFASQPPNAALDYTDPTRGPGHTVILELTHARYHHGTLTFTARSVPDSPMPTCPAPTSPAPTFPPPTSPAPISASPTSRAPISTTPT